MAVATELGTGHEVWLNKGSLVNALKASFALPGIFRPVQINGRWLIDGALVNPIPVSVCRALGARIVIAVNLSNDVFGKGSVIHDHEAFAEPLARQRGRASCRVSNGRAAVHLLHRQIFGRSNGAPGMSAVMMDAINITQDRIARSRLAGDPPDITIAPKVGGIGLFDFHRAGEAIELGAQGCREADRGDQARAQVLRALPKPRQMCSDRDQPVAMYSRIAAASISASAIRILTTSPIETRPISRPRSTTGMWRKRCAVISDISRSIVSASRQ